MVPLSFAGTTQADELSNVDQVVAAEAAGDPINRREALSKQTDNESQWQAGRVFINGQWKQVEDLDEDPLPSQLEQYIKQLDVVEQDIEGHRRLARWCQSHNLPEAAQVHWKALLAISGQDEQAHKALGHKRIGNRWFTVEEVTWSAQQQKQQASDLKEWMPHVRKIVAQLQSRESRTKLEGLRKLESIATDDAVVALKFGALQLEPTIALPLVAKIQSIRSKASCLALLEIALVEPNSEVGRASIQGLREYDEHFYVPELLRIIELPVEFEHRLVFLPNGSLVMQQAYSSENMTEKEYTEVLKLINVRNDNAFFVMGVTPPILLPEVKPLSMPYHIRINFPEEVYANSEQAENSIAYLAALESRRAQQRIDLMNALNAERERNAKTILSAISGISASASAMAFWDWWPNFNETYTGPNKPMSTKYFLDDSNYVVSLGGTYKANLYAGGPMSCLVAGTPIQTCSGTIDVDKIRVGNQVPSVNIATGEISWRPITLVSTRVADNTYVISLRSGDTIRATGGHNWWVVGEGWTRSRELKAGQYIRTSGTSVDVTGIQKIDTPVKVFNMIVDENHTYFVGKDRLLSWDVTSLQPTLQTAPGQRAQMYVEK
jgi:hypothetical protein